VREHAQPTTAGPARAAQYVRTSVGTSVGINNAGQFQNAARAVEVFLILKNRHKLS
jgi:hypothetical protein